MSKTTIQVKGFEISVKETKEADYICLTDIARYKNPDEPKDVIKNWLRLHNTIEYLGIWEQLYNPNFKGVEFDTFLKEAGTNAFTLSAKKWIESTNAIGITSKSGRYGGTYAHTDIAFKFASWISAEFELYLIKDYQRLKTDEARLQQIEWNTKRELAKINYQIHTDAIQEHIIPKKLTLSQINFAYASEADMLNVALFGITSKEWRDNNPELKGNMRDHTDILHLIVLVNIESMNAELIKQGLSQKDRLAYLNNMAIEQMTSLVKNQKITKLNEKLLPSLEDKNK